MIRILVPVNRLDRCKSRLAPLLGERERSEFVLLMLDDVLDAIEAFDADAPVVLLTRDEVVAGVAEKRGLSIRKNNADDLNGALESARGAFPSNDSLLVLPSDVPTVQAGDLQRLVEPREEPVALVRASEDGGTNGLFMAVASSLPFSFGRGSFDTHYRRATASGLSVAHLEIGGLQRDIDTPEDLRWLVQQEIPCRAREFLWERLPAVTTGDGATDALRHVV